jgi:cytochrome c oxidase cbb3-type subunit III
MRVGTTKPLILAPLIALALMTSSSNGQSQQNAAPSPGAGKILFEHHCAVCHGIDGRGGRGPSLNRVRLLRAPDDASLKKLILEGIPPEMPYGFLLSEEDVANLAAYVRSLSKIQSEPLPGDPVSGARVYGKSGCATCHILAGQGFAYGPELTDVGARRSASHLQETILNPAATLPKPGAIGAWTIEGRPIFGFLLVEAVTASGDKIQGIRLNEDTFSIQIEDAAGRFHSLRKQDLKEFRKLRGETPMPSFKRVLTASELQDLVAYLAAQRGEP